MAWFPKIILTSSVPNDILLLPPLRLQSFDQTGCCWREVVLGLRVCGVLWWIIVSQQDTGTSCFIIIASAATVELTYIINVLVVNSSYWHKMTLFWTEKQNLHMWTSWTRRENSLPQNWIEQKSDIKKHQVNENLLCVPSNLLQIDLLKIGGCRISKKIMFSAAIYHGRERSNIISSKSFVSFFGVLGSPNTLPGFLNTEKKTHAGNYCKCSQYSKPVTLHF